MKSLKGLKMLRKIQMVYQVTNVSRCGDAENDPDAVQGLQLLQQAARKEAVSLGRGFHPMTLAATFGGWESKCTNICRVLHMSKGLGMGMAWLCVWDCSEPWGWCMGAV